LKLLSKGGGGPFCKPDTIQYTFPQSFDLNNITFMDAVFLNQALKCYDKIVLSELQKTTVVFMNNTFKTQFDTLITSLAQKGIQYSNYVI
jgi:uncharacterized membrane protein